MRVLLVDDHADFLESAGRFLAAEPGLTVVGQASSGPEAVDKVAVLRPDVVLMDVSMPGMSGLEATRRIKARAAAPKVLLISMHDSAEHRMAAEDAGADGYVGKWEFAGSVRAALEAVAPPAPGGARDRVAARLRTLARLSHLVSSALDLEEVLQAISEAAAELMDAPVAAFWTADEAARTITKRAWFSEAAHADLPLGTLGYGDGALGWVALHRRTLHIPGVTRDSRFSVPDWAQAHGLVSMLGIPVMLRGTLLAVLSVLGPRPFHLGPEERDVLDGFVAQAAVAIRTASLHDEARRTRDFLQSNERLVFMGSLLAGVAHELSNPLFILRGRTEHLARKAAENGDASLMEVAEQLTGAAERCCRIVKTYLALAATGPPSASGCPSAPWRRTWWS